jgi:hypothetical protein
MKQLLALLLSLLVFLLPIQSILGVFAVNRLGLPISSLLWKEIVEVVIATILLGDIFRKLKGRSLSYIISKTWAIWLICILSLYTVFSSVIKISTSNIIFGFRFELFWVLFFTVVFSWFQVAQLETLEYLRQKIVRAIYYGFVPVLAVSYLTLILGQEKVLGFFGFGLSESKVLAQIPISHLVDGGGWSDWLRLSGTFTTPNHFAGYLLLILPFFLYRTVIERVVRKKLVFGFATVNIVVFIGLSFARFAWLSLLCWALLLGAYYFMKHSFVQKTIYVLACVLPLFIGIVAINLPEDILQKSLPTFLSKPSSTTFHARRTFATLDVLTTNPVKLWTGYGLGASGPAAKEEYTIIAQNPLYKENIDRALRYYLQPAEIVIPENWFIQLILNGGLIYGVLYCVIVLWPLGQLSFKLFGKADSIRAFEIYIFLGLFSIVIGNLFLHLWENQTVAIFYGLLILFIYKPHTSSPKN